MTVPVSIQSRIPSWQINIGAEGIAAAQFARCGFDVSVQYGADKPAYDLVVTKADVLLKVCVKGGQDGFWNLTQSYIKRAAELSGKKADYHGAIDLWLDHHASRTVCCLVQFQGVPIDQLPRIYLATPKEVALRLRQTAAGRGDSVLYEESERSCAGEGAGGVERLPASWRFSYQRIQELLAVQGAVSHSGPVAVKSASPARAWATSGILPIESPTALAMGA